MADATAVEEAVKVLDSGILISNLEIPVKQVADYFRSIPANERCFVMTKVIEVGTFCLERGQTAQDTDFVKRQINELLTTVETAVTGIPSRTETALISKLGTEDGQALAPVRHILNQVSEITAARINEVKTLLSQDLDPSKTTSTVGSALQRLRDLLDPQRNDSVQATVQSAVKAVTGKDGELAATVKMTVEDALKSMRQELTNLSSAIHGQEMVEEALKNTTKKGQPYEEEVSSVLQMWAKGVGAQVQHVGSDNQPGDFVVDLCNGSVSQLPIRIVIEARDRQDKMGSQRISQDLTVALAERKADVAVYVSKSAEGLAKAVGDWAEGTCERGPWVACVHENLVTALRFLVVQMQLKKLREAAPEIDSSEVQTQAAAIKTSLGRVKTIKSKITSLNSTSADIQKEIDDMKVEISAALGAIEDALRTTKKPASAIVGVSAQLVSKN
jgi:hypothetical protein